MEPADFLDQKRTEIGMRLKELRPFVDEYGRLEAAVTALDGVPRRRPRARASTPAGNPVAPRRGRGRPKGSGKRGEEALELVKTTPGMTTAEIAEKMGINSSYLYRVLPGLARDGLVTKVGHGWRPHDAAS
jgi:hypothetical protein